MESVDKTTEVSLGEIVPQSGNSPKPWVKPTLERLLLRDALTTNNATVVHDGGAQYS